MCTQKWYSGYGKQLDSSRTTNWHNEGVNNASTGRAGHNLGLKRVTRKTRKSGEEGRLLQCFFGVIPTRHNCVETIARKIAVTKTCCSFKTLTPFTTRAHRPFAANLFVPSSQLTERAACKEYHPGVLARDGHSDGPHDARQ